MEFNRTYLSSEEFDLMFEDELDNYFKSQDSHKDNQDYVFEKDAMETDYQYCK